MAIQTFGSREARNTVEAVSSTRAPFAALEALGRTAGAVPAVARRADRVGEEACSPYLRSGSKRALDLAAALSLLVLLLPLLALVATLIRLTSRGPVIFRQERCGAGGTPFVIYKFRSMYVAGDPAGMVVQATRSDPRVTPIGRFIRRTSIDELPQLVNIVQGHMSIIGPRPHATSHDAFYGACVPRYAERFRARPGLSGLAQVSGARGETPDVSDMERRVAFDLAYVRTASLGQDLRIIALTAREMFFSRTAY